MPHEFNSKGTVLVVDLSGLEFPGNEALTTLDLIDSLSAGVAPARSAIKRHGGDIENQEGWSLRAYWLGDSSEALAFNAALEILETHQELMLNDSAKVAITVFMASGTILGSRFGPPQQFQMIGEATTIAQRLEHFARADRSSLVLTEPVWNAVDRDPSEYQEVGRVPVGADGSQRVYSIVPNS